MPIISPAEPPHCVSRRLAIVSAYCLGYFRALCLWLRDEALKAGLPSSDLLALTRYLVHCKSHWLPATIFSQACEIVAWLFHLSKFWFPSAFSSPLFCFKQPSIEKDVSLDNVMCGGVGENIL